MKQVLSVFAVSFLAAGLLAIGPAAAQTMLPVTADEMAAKADVVLSGTCTKAEPEKKNGLSVMTYTFSVKEGIKGNIAGSTFSFSQWSPASGNLGPARLSPQYEVGKDYLLFLSSESKAGLRAPVGLGQGSFTLVAEKNGTIKAVNELNNVGLFSAGKAQQKSQVVKAMNAMAPSASGPVEYKGFVKFVKTVKDLNR